MSVLVKDMEMPQDCGHCQFKYINMSGYVICEMLHKQIVLEQFGARFDHCPLVEVPTSHGRLGDLDALYEEISNGNKAYNGHEGYDGKYPNIGNVDDCLDAIKYAETVIEAEGSTYEQD